MAEGLSYESFGATIGFSRAVLYQWEEKHPAWLAAKEVAFEHCLLFWEKAGRSGMFMTNFKAGVWVHNMKARFRKDGWNPSAIDLGGDGEYDFEYEE